MKLTAIFLDLIVLCALAVLLPASTIAARPLAVGPNGIDGADLSGDAEGVQGEVHSVWLGTHGIAVWTTSGSGGFPRIMGTRFGADGHPLDALPVSLVDEVLAFSDSRTVSLSLSGNEILLVWQNEAQGVLARHMAPDLTWLDDAVVLRSRAGMFPGEPYILSPAANAQRHLIALSRMSAGGDGIVLARVGSSSQPVREVFIMDTFESVTIISAAVAARPDGFLVVWESGGIDGIRRLLARTVGVTGIGSGPLQSLTAPGSSASDPSIRSNFVAAAAFEEGYAVAWSYSDFSSGTGVTDFPRKWRRLDAAGMPVSVEQELFPLDPKADANPLVLQKVNGGLLALSSESVPTGAAPLKRVIRRFLPAGGTAGPVEAFGEVQAMAPEQINIHPVAGGLLAVGEVRTSDIYSSNRSVMAAPLNAGYQWSQPSHLFSRGMPEQQACAVACRGTDYLVVWQDGRDGHNLASEIRGRFFTLAGEPVGASFRISNTPTQDISPAVAASGGKYLVAWTVNGRTSFDDNVGAALVSAPGVVSPSFLVAGLSDQQENGVAVAGGPNGGFFAAWRRGPVYIASQLDDIYGTWIDGNGVCNPPNGFPIAASPGRERAVSVAGGASSYGVVWRVGNFTPSFVYGAVVPGNAVAQPETPVPVQISNGSAEHGPEIAWNGSQYRIVWRRVQGTNVIMTSLFQENGETGPVQPLTDDRLRRYEPVIVARGAGWQTMWIEDVTRNTLQVTLEQRIGFATLHTTGQITTDYLASRFIDVDTLAAAAAPDGGVFLVYPVPGGNPAQAKEPSRTGALEAVLIRPDLPAVDPGFSFLENGPQTTLRWTPDPYYPRDAINCETSTDLTNWLPLSFLMPGLQAGGTGSEAILSFPALPEKRRYFRLNPEPLAPP